MSQCDKTHADKKANLPEKGVTAATCYSVATGITGFTPAAITGIMEPQTRNVLRVR